MTKRQETRRKTMPTQQQVREFWAHKLLALGKICDTEVILDPITDGWGKATYAEVQQQRRLNPFVGVPDHDDHIRAEPTVQSWQCFCCGRPERLDRAHIKPLALGGDNAPANIHLLCRRCHTESEVLRGEGYWRWFLTKPFRGFMDPNHYEHAWAALGAGDIFEAARIGVARFGTDPDSLREGVKTLLREAYGQSR